MELLKEKGILLRVKKQSIGTFPETMALKKVKAIMIMVIKTGGGYFMIPKKK